jgi:hypothetical protein
MTIILTKNTIFSCDKKTAFYEKVVLLPPFIWRMLMVKIINFPLKQALAELCQLIFYLYSSYVEDYCPWWS